MSQTSSFHTFKTVWTLCIAQFEDLFDSLMIYFACYEFNLTEYRYDWRCLRCAYIKWQSSGKQDPLHRSYYVIVLSSIDRPNITRHVSNEEHVCVRPCVHVLPTAGAKADNMTNYL